MPLISLRSPALLVLPLALGIAGCDRQSPPPSQPSSGAATEESAQAPGEGGEQGFNGTLDIANRGAAMPDFAFQDTAGRTLRSAELKGKPVLVNLWATWCGPCVLEMPMLDALAGKHPGKLRVVTISQDMGQPEKVKALFAEKKFAHLETWLDPENQLGFHYNTGMLPTSVLYDAQGREVWRMIGSHDWSSARTTALLGDVLGG